MLRATAPVTFMSKIKIQVLGSGCPTCQSLYDKVSEISQEIDQNLKVDYITDVQKIIELGLMSSPVLVINDKVISAGRLPDDEEIKNNILENLK